MGDTVLAAGAESLLPASAVVVSSWKVGDCSRVAEEGGSNATAVDVGDISGWMCRAADEFVFELESAPPVGEVTAAAAALSAGAEAAGVAGVAVATAVAAASSSGTVAALATMAGVGVS